MKNILILSSLLLSFTAMGADTGLNASSLRLKVYKMAVSTSPLCTNLVTIVDNSSSPTYIDVVGSAPMGTGTIVDGTYPCIAIEMSDNIKFTPSANSTSGHCSTSVESTLDVCSHGDTSKLIDGTSVTCSNGAGDNRVTMFLSTGSSTSNGSFNAFMPPTVVGDTTKGIPLGAALVVSGTTGGKFVVNPAGKVCDTDAASGACDGETDVNTNECRLEVPVFTFTKQ